MLGIQQSRTSVEKFPNYDASVQYPVCYYFFQNCRSVLGDLFVLGFGGENIKGPRKRPSRLSILTVRILIFQFWGSIHAQCELVTGSTGPFSWDVYSEWDIDGAG